MNENNINMQDDKLKALLSGTKIKASDNLKFRIMQQINTEKALSRKKATQSRPVLSNMFTVFGIMYAIIAVIGFGIYSSAGMEGLSSTSFYIPVILVSSICAMYWTITSLDDRRQSKKHIKEN